MPIRHVESETNDSTICLHFSSAFEMLDLVQVVADHVGHLLAFEEDAQVWLEVAIRESVINAIKHGNRNNPAKQVWVRFSMSPFPEPRELRICVRDEGDGFDPSTVPDPLAPENMLKSSGRGIFFMRSFMDDVRINHHPDGGMEVCLIKRLQARSE
jgi:serine/threonine-protein kinase RsbW